MDTVRKILVSDPDSARVARTPFGARIVIHATSEETGGALGMWETFTPPGQGPAPHTHTRETEVFRIIKGLYHFRCGEEEFEASSGAVITLPPFVPHSWVNIGSDIGQMFAIVSPGGCERLFIEIDNSSAQTPSEIAVIERRFGIINEATQTLGSE